MHFFRVLSVLCLILFASIAPARAACVATSHAGTVADVLTNFATKFALTTLWLDPANPVGLLNTAIRPAFATMAEQWTMTDMKTMELMSTYADGQQIELTKMDIQRIKAETFASLQPEEEVCSRISMGSRFLSTAFKADSVKRSLLQASLENQLSKLGSPGQGVQADYSMARYDHYVDNACTGNDLGGVLNGVCAVPSDAFIDSDIDPGVHFSKLTVDGNDPTGAVSTAHLQGFIENICGGQDLSLLPAKYYANSRSMDVIMDAYGNWQYAAFCRDSIVSYAAFKAPGDSPLMAEQRLALQEMGMTDPEIDFRYGLNPSMHAQMDIMVSAHKSPKAMGPDQMTQERTLLSYDAMALATELMLVDQYKDLFAQETRHLSLYLGLKLKDQREKANINIITASDHGGKS